MLLRPSFIFSLKSSKDGDDNKLSGKPYLVFDCLEREKAFAHFFQLMPIGPYPPSMHNSEEPRLILMMTPK